MTADHIFTQGHVSFTSEQLKGVPIDVLAGYTKRAEGDQEVYDITFQFQDILPLVCRLARTHLTIALID